MTTAEAISSLNPAGAIAQSLTAGFLEHMKRAGMRIREYPVAPGGTVNCTIRAEDDAVVSRLEAPLAGVRRVDELRSLDLGDGRIERWRLEDVPFDPQAGERPLGEYTFAHTPG